MLLTLASLCACLATLLVITYVSVYGEPKGAFISKYFTVTNMSTVLDSSSTNIIGIVKYIGNNTLNDARVVVELYDSNNRLMNLIDTPVTVHTLRPNEMSPFKVWTNKLTFDHYVVRMVGAVSIS